MTAEEFERAYAERSGVTVEQLRALGRIVAPCDCGDASCEGWQSTTREHIIEQEIFLHADQIYVRVELDGRFYSKALTELPPALALEEVKRLVAAKLAAEGRT